MKLKTILFPLFAAALMTVAPSTFAQTEEKKAIAAPFGLKWGQSKDEIRALGVKFGIVNIFGFTSTDKCTDEGAYEYCITNSLPKNIENVYFYRLTINPKYGLIEVYYESESFVNDSYGTHGKEAYQRIKDFISAKYGAPISEEYEGGTELSSNKYFYECLENEKCGQWRSDWEGTNDGFIQLRLYPESDDGGSLSLFYVSPDYSKAENEHAADAF